MKVFKIFIVSSHSYEKYAMRKKKQQLVIGVTSSCCRGYWPAQGEDVSKSVKHDEESEANPGEEEHANTLQETDRRTPSFLLSCLNYSRQTVCCRQWMSITFLRARRTRRATSAVRASSLWCHTGWEVRHDSNHPRPYQNCAADPHHEATDESLQTGAPS